MRVIPLSLQHFLEKTAYPLLEGSARFLLDWLIEGHRGYLETNPSTSPEHYFIAPDGKEACVSYSTTMDISIIREVFSALILSADVSLLSFLSLLQCYSLKIRIIT
jgi:alpha-L-fucosidase 2